LLPIASYLEHKNYLGKQQRYSKQDFFAILTLFPFVVVHHKANISVVEENQARRLYISIYPEA
jgi:hypothetical protein